jgi:hypothetical protein
MEVRLAHRSIFLTHHQSNQIILGRTQNCHFSPSSLNSIKSRHHFKVNHFSTPQIVSIRYITVSATFEYHISARHHWRNIQIRTTHGIIAVTRLALPSSVIYQPVIEETSKSEPPWHHRSCKVGIPSQCHTRDCWHILHNSSVVPAHHHCSHHFQTHTWHRSFRKVSLHSVIIEIHHHNDIFIT